MRTERKCKENCMNYKGCNFLYQNIEKCSEFEMIGDFPCEGGKKPCSLDCDNCPEYN